MSAPDDRTVPTVSYRHSPKPFGAPVSFVLKGDRLAVDTGRKQHEVRLGAVEEVRMTYEPGRLAQKAFRTRIRMIDGKTFTLSSLHWKSLAEAQDLGPDYRRFTEDLLRAIGRANPQARFNAGQPWWRWLITTGVAALSLLAVALLLWRAWQQGATSLVLMGAVLAAVGIWQLEPMVRLNRPRPFRPETPPADLLPR